MSKVHKLELDDLTIEIEVITDRVDNVDLVDCYVTFTPRSGLEVDDCDVERLGEDAMVIFTVSHEHTREEEWWEGGDAKDHALRDEGGR